MDRPDFYPCSMLAWGQHVKGTTVDRVYTRKADGRVEILTAEFSNGALLDVMIGPAPERTIGLYFWATSPLDPPAPVEPIPPGIDLSALLAEVTPDNVPPEIETSPVVARLTDPNLSVEDLMAMLQQGDD